MTFCEQNGVDYVFALAGTKLLARKVDEVCDAVRTNVRSRTRTWFGYAETRHAAGSWHLERRVIARIEAPQQGLDIRHVVTSLNISTAGGSMIASTGHADRPRT
ncbi:transposase [Bradyrhizobium sp. CCGUVB14]|uniref:transposase n=1 Tax=unclassified Bradyrhizobium TaxID=2631580 RepID=UPI0035C11289